MATKRGRSTSLRIAATLGLVAGVLVSNAPVAGAGQTCFGSVPTIFAVAGEFTVGTPGPDVIMGTSGPDEIDGLGGDDRICSRGGADLVDGGEGDDRISLGSGADTAWGGPGNDRLLGKRGRDRLYGNQGDDTLLGGSGRDRLSGGKGDDVLRGNTAADVLYGGTGEDWLSGGRGSDTIDGGPANDVLYGRSGADDLDGGEGTDVCNGGSGVDFKSNCEPGTSKPVPVTTPGPAPTPTPTATPTPTPAAGGSPAPTPGGSPTPTPSAGPVETLGAFIETSVLGTYSTSSPWLTGAWDYVDTQGTVQVQDLPSNIAGTVSSSCGYSSAYLGYCGGLTMTMDVNATESIDTIVHELAHVYEAPTGVLADSGPLGMAQLYFNVEWGSLCDASEVFADTLLYVTKPDAFLAYYLFACPPLAGTTSTPTAEAQAVMASMLAGTDPAWFGATYANGTQAWAAVMTLPFIDRIRVVTNLKNEFGGYCSESNTMSAAFFGGTDTNPWADDGC